MINIDTLITYSFNYIIFVIFVMKKDRGQFELESKKGNHSEAGILEFEKKRKGRGKKKRKERNEK